MKQYDRIAATKDRIREAMRAVNKKQVDLVRETGLNRGTIAAISQARLSRGTKQSTSWP